MFTVHPFNLADLFSYFRILQHLSLGFHRTASASAAGSFSLKMLYRAFYCKNQYDQHNYQYNCICHNKSLLSWIFHITIILFSAPRTVSAAAGTASAPSLGIFPDFNLPADHKSAADPNYCKYQYICDHLIHLLRVFLVITNFINTNTLFSGTCQYLIYKGSSAISILLTSSSVSFSVCFTPTVPATT